MALITTVGQTFVTSPLTVQVPYCSGQSLYMPQLMKSTSVGKLEPEHRIKPNPLYLTDRAKQHRAVYQTLVTRNVQTRRCAVGGFSYDIQNFLYNPGTGIPLTAPGGDPNWALALRNKIQDDKVSFAESIGEWRESAKMLGQTAGWLLTSIKNARKLLRNKRKRRQWRNWFKVVHHRDPKDKYELMDFVSVDLMIKFGIKPQAQLLWDMKDVLDRYLIAKRRIQVTLPLDEEIRTKGAYGGECVVRKQTSCRAIVFVRYDMNSREFTSGNLAEALWAGTTLSFMVDWFWNFGSYLSSFNAMKGVTSFEGVLCRRVRYIGIDRRINSYGYTTVVQPGRVVRAEFERQRFYSLPYAKLPGVSIPTTDIWGRLWSSIEVLASIRKSH